MEKLKAIRQSIDALHSQVKALNDLAESLRSEGVIDGQVYWRKNTYKGRTTQLMTITTSVNSNRVKEGNPRSIYIGNDPAKQQLALDAIKRFAVYSKVLAQIEAKKAHIKRIEVGIDTLLFQARS